MDSLEQLLAEMTLGQQGERGLEFRIDPTRVRQTLATLIKADRLLWLKHLLQWLYDLPLEEPPILYRPSKDILFIDLLPSQLELSDRLTPTNLAQREGLLLDQNPESRLARILCEIEAPVLYLHSAEPSQALHISAQGFQLQPAVGQAPPRGLRLITSNRALLSNTPLLAISYRTTVRRLLQPLLGLHPQPPRMESMVPLTPDWPFIPVLGDSFEDIHSQWDWESVDPAQEGGFLWTVSAWGEPLTAPETSKESMTVYRNPVEIGRSLSKIPLMGCYPPGLARQITPEPGQGEALLTLPCQRVFGISWTASAPRKAKLFPILRGVPGNSITLDTVPAGLYLIVDASHLKSDASGLALVHNVAMESWLAEQLSWAKIQTKAYLPFVTAIPHCWMIQTKLWENVGRPPGVLKKIWNLALTGLFSMPPVQSIIEKRIQALSFWAHGKD